jgi:hypothetical protein
LEGQKLEGWVYARQRAGAWGGGGGGTDHGVPIL